MKYQITHTTTYEYQSEVGFTHNQVILKPLCNDVQNLVSFECECDPKPSYIHEFTDLFGNHKAIFVINQTHKKLHVASKALIEIKRTPFHATSSSTYEQTLLFLQSDICDWNIKYFRLPSSLIVYNHQQISTFAQRFFLSHQNLLDRCLALMEYIYKEFRFESGSTTTKTTVDEIFETKKGVCQDFAHLFIACIRSVGLAARYVSGYIETLPPKGEEKLIGVDASHAWASVYISDIGWVDFDPTNNMIPSTQHISVAYGRDFSDIVPLRGVILSSGQNLLRVGVHIERIKE